MFTRPPIILRLLLALPVLAVVATGCSSEPQSSPTGAGNASPPGPPPIGTNGPHGNPGNVTGSPSGNPNQQSLEQIAREYEVLQTQAEQTNRQMATTLSQYQRRGGKLPPNFGSELTPGQRDLLALLILNERADTRDLLQDILDKDSQIRNLRSQMQSMRGRLPDHAVAKEGDRHDHLAIKYLVNRGVSRDKATAMVAQVSLHETLLPGFNVWTYYADGQFGSWVTKGTASITPQQQEQRIVRDLTEAKVLAEKASATLKGQLDTVRQEEQKKVDSALDQAKNANAETSAAFAMLEAEKEAKRRAESTIVYVAGSKKQLERQGVIRGNRVLDATLVRSVSVNVTASPEIVLEPGDFELRTVKKVTVLPDMFVQGRDYQILKDGAAIRFQLLNLDRFRRNQFVLVLE